MRADFLVLWPRAPAHIPVRASWCFCRNLPLLEILIGLRSPSPRADTFRFGPATAVAIGYNGTEEPTRGTNKMSESPNIRSRSARHRARLGERGMSLLELVIAMAVLTIGMMGSMVMILTGMQSNSRNKTDNTATVLDQEILEMFATLKQYPKTGYA